MEFRKDVNEMKSYPTLHLKQRNNAVIAVLHFSQSLALIGHVACYALDIGQSEIWIAYGGHVFVWYQNEMRNFCREPSKHHPCNKR